MTRPAQARTLAAADSRSPAERMQELADSAPQPLDRADCAACPHPVARHDSLGPRFRHATLKAAIARGCICRPS
ncbi:RGCVC family protein [Geodermatophilus poikilotrophus]|uniref:RGCVC family protein n=1 Tax=Geodermatophilus poikilotrophus TaxID=1333667 RepID=UPI001C311EF4